MRRPPSGASARAVPDPEFPLVWRLRKEVAGSGALGDIGAHIVERREQPARVRSRESVCKNAARPCIS